MDQAILAAAREKLAVAERSEWIDKIVLTGEEARALHAAFKQLEEARS